MHEDLCLIQSYLVTLFIINVLPYHTCCHQMHKASVFDVSTVVVVYISVLASMM